MSSPRLTPRDIAQHWCTTDDNILPWHTLLAYGWGAAMCFGCGWLVPPITTHTRPGDFDRPWVNWSEHFLDVVKLSPAAKAVSGHVVLCHLCADDAQTEGFRDKDHGFEWVRTRAQCPRGFQEFTDQALAGVEPETITRDATLVDLREDYRGLGESHA